MPQVAKKLVDSDFKNHRVEDPTRISARQENQVKKYVKDFFDKVVAQKKAHDKQKDEQQAARERKEGQPACSSILATPAKAEKETGDIEAGQEPCDNEVDEKLKQESATPFTPIDSSLSNDQLKRKREAEGGSDLGTLEDGATPIKRQKSASPPPPPPPPPPATTSPAGSIEHRSPDGPTEADLMDVDDPGHLTHHTDANIAIGDTQKMTEPMDGLRDIPQVEDDHSLSVDRTAEFAIGGGQQSPLSAPMPELDEKDRAGFASNHLQGVEEVTSAS